MSLYIKNRIDNIKTNGGSCHVQEDGFVSLKLNSGEKERIFPSQTFYWEYMQTPNEEGITFEDYMLLLFEQTC